MSKPELQTAEWPEFSEACGRLIKLARELRPRIVAGDLSAAGEFGEATGTWFAEAGTTADEAAHYGKRILAMVLAEPQA